MAGVKQALHAREANVRSRMGPGIEPSTLRGEVVISAEVAEGPQADKGRLVLLVFSPDGARMLARELRRMADDAEERYG